MASEAQSIANVYYNDLLLEHILSFVHAPQDKARVKLSSHRLKNFCDKFETDMKTLTISKYKLNNTYFAEVKLENFVQVHKLSDSGFTKSCVQKVLRFLPKDELPLIKRVIIKGIMGGVLDTYKFYKRISVCQDLGQLLDQCVGIKQLEMSRVDFGYTELENSFLKSKFIQRLTTLKILDCVMKAGDLYKLIGKKVTTLHLTEKMIRLGEYRYLRQAAPSIDHVTIYLDDKKWSRTAADESRLWILNNCYTIPWHLMYEKTIKFEGDQPVAIRHRKDLKKLTLQKLDRAADNDVIMNTISDLPRLKQLETLSIDGYYTTDEMQKFGGVLKNCESLKCVELRMRQFTENPEDWIVLIEHLPKRLHCVKLDSIVDDLSIDTLKTNLSTSLKNLEIITRKTPLSFEAQKMIYQGFRKLVYLRIKGNRFDQENIALLKFSKIPRIDYLTSHHDGASKLVKAMKVHYHTVDQSYGPGFSSYWKLTKKPRRDPRRRQHGVRMFRNMHLNDLLL